ncbi:MAG: hypothetical protein HUJ29_02155 [Gammaproteobacteria bacterium]|nr:hypothetical protein [Gammaproteobacteria bacterium]
MIDIAFIILFLVMTYKIFLGIGKEAAIFREYNQPLTLKLLILLFPVGPFIYSFVSVTAGWLPAGIVSYLCYLPALIISRKNINAFERSGTDRTNKALSVSNLAFGTSLLGLIYVSLFFLFDFVESNIESVGT